MKEVEDNLIISCRKPSIRIYNQIMSGAKNEKGYIYVITKVTRTIKKNGKVYTKENINNSEWCTII